VIAAALPAAAPLQPVLPEPSLTAIPVAAPPPESAGAVRAEPPAPLAIPAAVELPPAAPQAAATPAPAPAPDCLASMTATAEPMGVARLTLAAPCAPSRAVVIHHEGMRFTILTDVNGSAEVAVPALAVAAMFVADLGDGQGAIAQVALPDVAGLDRAVLQGLAGQGLALHAFRDGAAFGSPGHVWHGAGNDATGGTLHQLGTSGLEGALTAEVYTFPPGTPGHATITVEAEVTATNCAQTVEAQLLQLSPGGAAFRRDLSLTMPGCDAVGEFLAMPDAMFGITVAAN
jgi:hypothetical protein